MPEQKAKEYRTHSGLMDDDQRLIDQIVSDYKKAKDITADWREEARELYDLVAGDQWDEISRAKMEDELRPITTFNITVKYLDAVSGLEIGNRQEVRYLPRELGDAGVNELLTNAAKWVRDECDADDEESESFLDMILTGMGWTETFIETDADPEGEIKIERRDGLEMFWDMGARKRNLDDKRWVMRVRPATLEEIAEQWPGKLDGMSATDIQLEDVLANSLHDATNAWRYEGNADISGRTQKDNIPLIDYQWWTYDTKYHVATAQRGSDVVDKRVWKKMQEFFDLNGVPYQVEPFKVRKFYRAIVAGNVVLEKGESPYQDGFTYKVMTGRRDRNTNTWFGLGRILRDPQLWLNKFFSQILHTLNSNSKGGIMAIREAFANPSKAEADWARPDAITWMEKTSDEHGNPTVIPKPQVPYPQGMDRLMTFTVDSLPNITGLNLELLGLASKVQPGIVEAHRKQAGMTMIQWAFDSKRRYTKDQGRMLATYIREYISDGRLIRVDGELGPQFVPLLRDESMSQYDVIVDEAPSSPNNKERVWALLVEMLPTLMQQGYPIPPDVLDYAPLPASLAQKWKEMATQAMSGRPDPAQQAMQQMAMASAEAELQKKQAEVQKLAAEAALKQGQTQTEQVVGIETAASADLKRAQANKTRREANTELARANAEIRRAAAETGRLMGGA